MSLTTITRPGNPLWDCCKAKPAGVVSYDDGTAVVVCAHCLSTVTPPRRHELPPGWRLRTLEDDAQVLAQTALDYHTRVACHEVRSVADCRSKEYRASEEMLMLALGNAYPKLDAKDIYAVWLDCMESAAYCADYVASHPKEDIPTA